MESLTSGGAMGCGVMALVDVMSSGINPTDAMAGGVRIGDYMVASSGSVPIVGPDGRLHVVSDRVLSRRDGAGAGDRRDARVRRRTHGRQLPSVADVRRLA